MSIDVASFTFFEPLYSKIKIENKDDIRFLFSGSYATFDGFNPIDKIDTTFHYRSSEEDCNTFYIGSTSSKIWRANIVCRRTSRAFHIIVFWDSEEHTIEKVGQYPSVADFHTAKIKSYRNVFDKESEKELMRAIGLSAHGIGIGSFVYLRRVFERLIMEAFKVASTQGDIDSTSFTAARMNEKIAMLNNYLPEFLIQNKELYGILSKGIHELDENTCLNCFEVVRLGIEMILDEKLVAYEREQKIKHANLKIKEIHAQIKN